MTDKSIEIEAALSRTIEARDARNPTERRRVYDAARRALDKAMAARGESPDSAHWAALREGLDRAVARIEARHAPAEEPIPTSDEELVALGFEPAAAATPRGAAPDGSRSASRTPWVAAVILVIAVIGGAGTWLVQSGLIDFDSGAPAVAGDPPASAGAAFAAAAPFAFANVKGVAVLDDDAGFVTMTNTPGEQMEGTGPSIVIPAAAVAPLIGKPVTVTFTVRSAASEGAQAMLATYYTAGAGNSGRRSLALEREFGDVSFDYDLPQQNPPKDHVLSFFPDGAGKSIDIRSLRIDPKAAQ
jgi:hypothetical protein